MRPNARLLLATISLEKRLIAAGIAAEAIDARAREVMVNMEAQLASASRELERRAAQIAELREELTERRREDGSR